MFQHVLVPLDGSRLAEAALPVAVCVAERLGATVTLLHVIERGAPAAVHGQPHLTDPGRAEQYLEEVRRRAFPPVVSVASHVHRIEQADVARSLVDHGVELGADLVVMCTHGAGGLRHRLFGTVAQKVIALGRLPVLLVPAEAPAARRFACRHALVPLDGRPAHEQALPVAAALVRSWKGTVHLLRVVPTLTTLAPTGAASAQLLPGTTVNLLDLEEDRGREYVEAQRARLQANGVDATADVVRGDAVGAIIDAARRFQADLVIVGTHGRRGMEAFWAGSVAPRLVGRVAVPLLLVPVK